MESIENLQRWVDPDFGPQNIDNGKGNIRMETLEVLKL
jgi:hypothetical protein